MPETGLTPVPTLATTLATTGQQPPLDNLLQQHKRLSFALRLTCTLLYAVGYTYEIYKAIIDICRMVFESEDLNYNTRRYIYYPALGMGFTAWLYFLLGIKDVRDTSETTFLAYVSWFIYKVNILTGPADNTASKKLDNTALIVMASMLTLSTFAYIFFRDKVKNYCQKLKWLKHKSIQHTAEALEPAVVIYYVLYLIIKINIDISKGDNPKHIEPKQNNNPTTIISWASLAICVALKTSELALGVPTIIRTCLQENFRQLYYATLSFAGILCLGHLFKPENNLPENDKSSHIVPYALCALFLEITAGAYRQLTGEEVETYTLLHKALGEPLARWIKTKFATAEQTQHSPYTRAHTGTMQRHALTAQV